MKARLRARTVDFEVITAEVFKQRFAPQPSVGGQATASDPNPGQLAIGDVIITHENGQRQPMKRSTFDAIYEPIPEPPPESPVS
jgi:hypothetical protein